MDYGSRGLSQAPGVCWPILERLLLTAQGAKGPLTAWEPLWFRVGTTC